MDCRSEMSCYGRPSDARSPQKHRILLFYSTHTRMHKETESINEEEEGLLIHRRERQRQSTSLVCVRLRLCQRPHSTTKRAWPMRRTREGDNDGGVGAVASALHCTPLSLRVCSQTKPPPLEKGTIFSPHPLAPFHSRPSTIGASFAELFSCQKLGQGPGKCVDPRGTG